METLLSAIIRSISGVRWRCRYVIQNTLLAFSPYRPKFPLHSCDKRMADVFVVIPLHKPWTEIYDSHIVEVVGGLRLTVNRGDSFFHPDIVMTDVWTSVFRCQAVIADCTDARSNVFYEIGMAHTLGRPVILITQNINDVPFDLRNHRCIEYSLSRPELLRKNLRRALQQVVASRQKRNWLLTFPLALGLLLLFLGCIGSAHLARNAQRWYQIENMRELHTSAPIASVIGPSIVRSPDGATIVFVSETKEYRRSLYRQDVGELTARPIAETEGAYEPFFSPDGTQVGFFAKGWLKTVNIQSHRETVTPLLRAPAGRGATWGRNGQIVAALDTMGGLTEIITSSRKSCLLTTPEHRAASQEITHRWPHFIPDSDIVLFNSSKVYANYENSQIKAVTVLDNDSCENLGGDPPIRPQERIYPVKGCAGTESDCTGMNPQYLTHCDAARWNPFPAWLGGAGGCITYVKADTLVAWRFDPDSLKHPNHPSVMGNEIESDVQVSNNPTLGSAQFDISPAGKLTYLDGRQELRSFSWLKPLTDKTPDAKRLESIIPFPIPPGLYTYPRLSRDGSRLAYVETNKGATSLVVCEDLNGPQSCARVRPDPGDYNFSVWVTPELFPGKVGSRADFLIFRDGGGIFWRNNVDHVLGPLLKAPKCDRTGDPCSMLFPTSFADGKLVLFEVDLCGRGTILTVAVHIKLTGEHAELVGEEPKYFATSAPKFNNCASDNQPSRILPVISPDGHWLAYLADTDKAGGGYQPTVSPLAGPTKEKSISSLGGPAIPIWSGKSDLYFRTSERQIVKVNYDKRVRDKFRLTSTETLTSKPLPDLGFAIDLDFDNQNNQFITLTHDEWPPAARNLVLFSSGFLLPQR
jgi:hypothetical protein